MRQYPLLLNDRQAGEVLVTQEGLYCKITCTCSNTLPADAVVIVSTQTGSLCLGRCRQDSHGIVLRRFVSSKILGRGVPIFRIDCNQNAINIVPLDPSKAFNDIAMLPVGKFRYQNSEAGILFEKTEAETF